MPSERGKGPARIYDRVAPVSDLYSGPMEWTGGARRRRRVLARATGEVLEAGVGTGLNLEHYPPGVHVTLDVADPVQGLRELARVAKPAGRVLLLEQVRPRNRPLGALADLVSPLARRLFGPEVNRRTERNVAVAGLEIVTVRREGVWREIEARPGVGEA
ncbi:MAG: hypothetical protein ACNA8R_04535 [Nitriliruptoraceae bacterium]